MKRWAVVSMVVALFVGAGCSGMGGTVAPSDPSAKLEDLPEIKPVKHGWIDPSVKLGSYKNVWLDPIQCTAPTPDSRLMEYLKGEFERVLRANGKSVAHGGLKVSVTVTKISRPWAGLGMDVLVSEEGTGKTVAKFRHFIRGIDDDVNAVGTRVVEGIVAVVNRN